MISFNDVTLLMREHGLKTPDRPIRFGLPDGRRLLHSFMQECIGLEGRKMIWLPEYEAVADWLTDNRGKGLFLYGNCGRGKSILCRYVLPAIFLSRLNRVVRVYDIQEMNSDIDGVLTKRLVSLDDIGTEEVSVKYGERRMAFAEVMDMAEKRKRLVIVSTNLNQQQLAERYGERTVDRIKSTTKRILFKGESLRQ